MLESDIFDNPSVSVCLTWSNVCLSLSVCLLVCLFVVFFFGSGYHVNPNSVCSFHLLAQIFVNSKFSICYILLSVFNYRQRLDVHAQFSCIPISFVTDILWHVRWNCAKWLYSVTIVDVTVEIFIFYKKQTVAPLYIFTCK